jgi:primosomal protein N'
MQPAYHTLPGLGDRWGSPEDAPTYECQHCGHEQDGRGDCEECGSGDVRRL